MGCGTSKDATTEKLDRELKALSKNMHTQVKILLLGPGESGKSTVFKQMKIIQEDGGFSDVELHTYKPAVYQNCISQMRCIIEAAVQLRLQFESKETFEYAQTILRSTRESNWSEETGQMIKALWSDKSIREIYAKRGKVYQLNETASYFFENIDRFMDTDYKPSVDDVLRVRVRSTGIEEAEFKFDKRIFKVVDVGGQRSERRKWEHCFDDVTAVLFCASLASYDIPLREDPRQKGLMEALMLFQEVVNSKNFETKAIIFFLNKTDLFREKIKTCPLSEQFIDYTGGADYDEGCKFIKSKFLEKVDVNLHPMDLIFTHFTCALDTQGIELVMHTVKKQLLNEVMEEMGIVI